MTSILSYPSKPSFKPQANSFSSHIQIPSLKQAPTLVLQHSFLNNIKPSTLLTKRRDNADLGDLLTKKLKTKSMNSSKNNSNQQSPQLRVGSSMEEEPNLRESFERAKQDLFNGKESPASPTSASTKSYSSESNFDQQETLLNSPTQFSSPQRAGDNGYYQLKHALDLLQRKMVFEQELEVLKEAIFQPIVPQEPLYIPPLRSSPSVPKETVKPKPQNLKNSQKKKKEEEELEFCFGPVEFPFLSISAPLPQVNDFQQNLILPSITTQNIPALSSNWQQPSLNKDLTDYLPLLDKNVKHVEIPKIESSRQSLNATRAGTQKSAAEETSSRLLLGEKKSANKKQNSKNDGENQNINIVKEQEVQTQDKDSEKEKEREREREKEKEIEKAKKLRQENEDLYARPLYGGKKPTERRRNKWQLSQDEKFKGLEFPSIDQKENGDIFFKGSQKKSAITPIGPEHQVDVSMALIQANATSRRKPQLKWDPSAHDQVKLEKFFSDSKKLLNGDFNEERAIYIILNNQNNLKKALEYIKANKAVCRESLALKTLL